MLIQNHKEYPVCFLLTTYLQSAVMEVTPQIWSWLTPQNYLSTFVVSNHILLKQVICEIDTQKPCDSEYKFTMVHNPLGNATETNHSHDFDSWITAWMHLPQWGTHQCWICTQFPSHSGILVTSPSLKTSLANLGLRPKGFPVVWYELGWYSFLAWKASK